MKNYILILSFLMIFQSFLFSQQKTYKLQEGNPSQVEMSEKRLSLLDQHINKFINEGHLPGGVFLVARRGRIVYHKNFGYQSLDKKKPYQKDNIFRLASMTKALTTVGIMQLFEQGKLRLDDPIFYYIPAFAKSQVLENFNEVDSSFTTIPAKQPITIRHLLTHTSGITYGVFNPGPIEAMYTKVGANNFGLSHDKMSTEQMANKLAGVPLIFHPGEQYMYGYNMEVLGRIIEVLSGQPLNQYFRKNILDPLGLKDTDFYFPPSKHDRIVPLYTYNEERKMVMASDEPDGELMEYPKMKDNNHYAGGGGMSGTTIDYAVFIQALLNNGTYNGKRILSRKSIDVMTSDQMIILNQKGKGYSKVPGITFGLGFEVITEEGQAVSHKSAGNYSWGGLFNTKFFIDPKEELIFVGMTQILPFTRPDFWDKTYAIIYGALD